MTSDRTEVSRGRLEEGFTRGVNHILLTMAFCRSFATATAIAVHSVSLPVAEDTALDD